MGTTLGTVTQILMASFEFPPARNELSWDPRQAMAPGWTSGNVREGGVGASERMMELLEAYILSI